MSWRERLHVKESRAEIDVLLGLHEQGIHPIRDHIIILDATVPDFYFPGQRLCVFLDGSVHTREHQRLRDEHVDECLRRQGYRVLRIPYQNPLSKIQREEIVATIKEALK